MRDPAVERSMDSVWLRHLQRIQAFTGSRWLSVRCVCCGAVKKIEMCTFVREPWNTRTGAHVVNTCSAYYCRDRAARGLLS